MKYRNPIIRGCYPDPSVCRAGDDFYIVNSSFEFFPAIPISHSRDLVHWDQIGYCVDREGQLAIQPGGKGGRQSAAGIYATSIRYKNGTFYMVTTNTFQDKDGGNFFVSATDPAGDWSDPIFLDTPGIDPSFFFDEDGRDYYVGTARGRIYVVEIDLATGKMLSEPHDLWGGTGGSYPEGPHIYKKDGWYYLLISEGATERSHMITMARSRSLTEGYEPCPYNPVLTNRSLLRPIESVGHADLVEDQNGNWWAVCLGTRTFSYPPKHNLGRETMLVPVDWSGDWPVFGNHGSLDEVIEVPLLPGIDPADIPAPKVDETACEDEETLRRKAIAAMFGKPEIGPDVLFKGPESYATNFETKPDVNWNYLYNPELSRYSYGDGATLLGNAHSLSDMAAYTWLGRRQRAHDTLSTVTLTFPTAQDGEEAGLTIFMNHKHHYAAAILQENGVRKLVFYRRIGTLVNRENEIVLDTDTVTLELESDKDWYTFYYRVGAGHSGASGTEVGGGDLSGTDAECSSACERIFLGRGETVYITTEVGGSFTGNFIALYAMGNGADCVTPARFNDFTYEEKPW